MTAILNEERPVLFLGIADFAEATGQPFPVGGLDLFQLSHHKSHIVYPGMIATNVWVLLVRSDFLQEGNVGKWQLRIVDEKDVELGTFSLIGISNEPGAQSQSASLGPQTGSYETVSQILLPKDGFTLLHFQLDGFVNHPGRYVVQSVYEGKIVEIGSVHFHYQKAPTLTPDQIKAIESDPNSAKVIGMDLGCKFCSTKLKVYTGLKRFPKLEREGYVWQTDLEDDFKCQCGKTQYSLQYLRESMHGMLLRDFSSEISGLSYVRRYGHSQVAKVVEQFTKLLDTERLEPPIQDFIEKHPILLSRFSAKRLFVKPNIVGRFEADFGVVDSRNQLWLIELEKPSMKLFKKDGHPTAELMHAYGQVTDWLDQCSKYRGAILDALELKENDTVAVRGAVIAGRSTTVTHEVLQRHLSNPPYPNIEFLTLDDLATSLLNISKKLA